MEIREISSKNKAVVSKLQTVLARALINLEFFKDRFFLKNSTYYSDSDRPSFS